MIIKSLILSIALFSSLADAAAEQTLSLSGHQWRIQNASLITADSEEIISQTFDDSDWVSATVPGTVLADYTAAGLVPDPLYGGNMHQISDPLFSGNDFWYRTTVTLPADYNGKRLFLDFSGINWKADIYFNGQPLGRINGAYMRGEFDITKWAVFAGSNTIAVRIHHPKHWVPAKRKVLRKSLGCRITNGDELGYDSPACLAAAGWNWLPIMRGRNIGIWNHVTIHARGNVSIKDSWVESNLPLPDTSSADLTIRSEVKNHSDQNVNGTLIAEFDQTRIELPVELKANEEKAVAFDTLTINEPRLWWPNGYGEPNLTELKLTFVENETVSDTGAFNFGIRQFGYEVVDKVLFVYCNGTRILIRGGNWGLPEAMMRCDLAGFDLRIQLHREANLNMIRNWIGMTNREEFYDACDRYGMLIFDDFWLANPADGPEPLDQDMFMENAEDKIKWVRKHPSVALYCGRNEGNPPKELDAAMRAATEALDGSRHYVPNSARGTLTGFGPYDVRSPNWYFQNRGKTFHTEQGIIAFPEVESMRAMMPEKDLWPISDMWAIHNYQTGRSHKFTETITTRFGEPTGIDDYCRRAQLHNYESAKAIMESLQSNQGSGVLLWMSQSAWPSLICQLYDHYFAYTASYFATKKASSPVHILWDCEHNEIRLANNTQDALENVTVVATVYDANGSNVWKKSITTNASPTTAITCFELETAPTEKTQFLKLELSNNEEVISDNFYWLENSAANCLDLNELPTADVSLNVVNRETKEGFLHATLLLKNNESSIALLNMVQLKDAANNDRILPVFYDDNYVSLLPGEERTLTLRVSEEQLKGKQVELHLRGWNTSGLEIRL
ncbi:glycoside hydrolase family 2 TIM barrel-domain containing protein [Pontiellaceae bacterium B1224]|nr:glycoside hydrolase family 2 TIM barrel-domain containing protein [Pontiellaceae bacterium B1224]